MAWATSSLFLRMLLESGDLPWKHLLIHMINTIYTNAFNHLEISFFKKSSVNVSLIMYSKYCLPWQVWVSSVSLYKQEGLGINFYFFFPLHETQASCNMSSDLWYDHQFKIASISSSLSSVKISGVSVSTNPLKC